MRAKKKRIASPTYQDTRITEFRICRYCAFDVIPRTDKADRSRYSNIKHMHMYMYYGIQDANVARNCELKIVGPSGMRAQTISRSSHARPPPLRVAFLARFLAPHESVVLVPNVVSSSARILPLPCAVPCPCPRRN